MKKWRKLIAATLISSMLLGTMFVTGCGKKRKEGEVISEDTPWYDVQKINISDIYYKDGKDYEYLYFNYLDKSGDNYVVSVEGNLRTPADYEWDDKTYQKYVVNDIILLDKNGKLVNKVNMKDVVSGDYEYINRFDLVGDNKLEVQITVFEDENWEKAKLYKTIVDLNTGEASKREVVDVDLSPNNEEFSFEGSETIGDYKITKYYISGNKPSYMLEITDKSGKAKKIDMSKEFPNLAIWNIDNILPSGSDSCIILAAVEEESNTMFKLDLKSSKITKADKKDSEWLKDVDTYRMTVCGDACYSITDDGLQKLDFNKMESSEVFSFDDSNINRSEAGNYSIVDVSDTKTVFFTVIDNYLPYTETRAESYIVVVTKADTNPHVGKTILTLCDLSGGDNSVIADAVADFNDTNSEYFIKYDNKYNLGDKIDWSQEMNEEQWTGMIMKAQSDMSNELAIDLMNGEGPDIIIGGFQYGQLNNDDYLEDLTPYLKDLGTSNYFSNVIDGAKVDGCLYQIPTSFVISGIVTDRKNISKGQTGFTFDEYKKFVDKVCNGKDPITQGQVSYFLTCINSSGDLFIDGGKSSYNNEAFKEIAEYVKNNVPKEYDWGIEDDGMVFEEWTPEEAVFSSFSGFSGYLDTYNYELGPQDQVILGLPSYDGRGPQVEVVGSIAISASAVDADACWDFVKVILSDKAQKSIAQRWSFPVNISAYESTAEDMVASYNKGLDANYSISGMPKNATKIDKSVVKTLEADVITKSHVVISDPSISIIVAEEIPAYFSGQKKIDQVTDVIENRVNTVLKERG